MTTLSKPMKSSNSTRLYTDGGARGNPGPSGAGIVIKDANNSVVVSNNKYLGIKTNNESEYLALIFGLECAKQKDISDLNVFMDSELVVKQINGQYKVKNARLYELYSEVKELSKSFDTLTFTHIPRKENSEADLLVNLVIDEYTNK